MNVKFIRVNGNYFLIMLDHFMNLLSFFQIAKDSSVEKLIERLKSWYMEKDGEHINRSISMCQINKLVFVF